MFTLGALLYEAEQAWTERVFDFYDVLATVFAYTIIMAINTNEPVKT
ncbi:hypothetical protein GPAL_2622 [Glaciecola pallidula DSM 14239 = ACAM 615]|uniref:Uncharacterized protein n=2 Tax=Brumicola TaxID=3160924 RepID=K6YZU9_9ALTE|nr:hypothetical protein GPAL_2622 [Glaciecola pallidula DSM 14239 = ACAM 615]